MIKTSTILLGTGVLMAGLATPLAASADSTDEALAFVVGAAVGYAVGDHDDHRHRVHRRDHGYGSAHYRQLRWRHPQHGFAHRWRPEHPRYHGHGRHDRRHDGRHERRHERHDRRHDRHERRHERRDRHHG